MGAEQRQGLGSESHAGVTSWAQHALGPSPRLKIPVRLGRDLAVDPWDGPWDGSEVCEAPKGEVSLQAGCQSCRLQTAVMQRPRIKAGIRVSSIR